jgi:hypothetical protein
MSSFVAPVSASDLPPPARVFQRTAKGQAIAAAPFSSQLGHMHQRILLMVNGFTPLSALDDLAHLSGQAVQIAEDLLARGLVAECKPRGLRH